jgi:alkylated DNA repair dioxygenase AlkB
MEATNVQDVFIQKNFLTIEEEKSLLESIDSCPWVDNRRGDRQVQIYGPYHDHKYNIIPGKYSIHPTWLQELAKKVHNSVNYANKDKLLDYKRCEVYINEYNSSNDLQYHFDSNTTFDECIYGISLNSDSHIGFKKKNKTTKVLVPARSIYVMSGIARTEYKHGIDLGWITGRRVSITFRTVK